MLPVLRMFCNFIAHVVDSCLTWAAEERPTISRAVWICGLAPFVVLWVRVKNWAARVRWTLLESRLTWLIPEERESGSMTVTYQTRMGLLWEETGWAVALVRDVVLLLLVAWWWLRG